MQQYEGIELENRYLLRRVVDTGSFGAVYEATDQKFDSRVAVKVLYSSDVDSGTFRSEALLARQFRHPNVVEVYEFGVDGQHDVAYIVMEFLEGVRADQLIAETRFQLRLFVRFVDQIGSALHSAHTRNLVHRDLKPQNIMLVDRGQPTERYLLLDLGIASKTDALATLRNQALDGAMSPQYASPEQILNRDVGHLSDVYSFGTIMFEWLTGRLPFESSQLLGLANAICTESPPRLSEMSEREIHSDVEAIVLQCLEKEPEYRPDSINEVRTRILQIMAPDTLHGFSTVPDAAARKSSENTDAVSGAAAQTLWPSTTSPQQPKLAKSSVPSTARTPAWQTRRSSRMVSIGVSAIVLLFALGIFGYLLWPRSPVWIPDGFEPEPLQQTPTVSKMLGVTLYERIFRKIGDQHVSFILVPETIDQSNPMLPYYIMQDKVWNALVLLYADLDGSELPTVSDGTGWMQGAIAIAKPPGIENYPRLPATNLTAFQAHAVARWIGGQTAHLPTAEQWDRAAGYGKSKAGDLKGTEWENGPYKQQRSGGTLGVAVGRWHDGPLPVGTSPNDVSPFGCRDMAGNGEEWTSSVIGSTDTYVPNCAWDALVFLRSRSYLEEFPLTWTDYEDEEADAMPKWASDGSQSNPVIGFRVVIEIQPPQHDESR